MSKEGWAKPFNTRKYHYFVKSKSLCGRWMFFGKDLTPHDGGPLTKVDCKTCYRLLQKRLQKQKEEGSE